jgi:hypothetical protein
MRLILGLFFIVSTAGAIAQQYSTASSAPVLPDAVPRPSETLRPETETFMPSGAASLPDAPGYATRQPSVNASTLEPKGILGVMTNSLTVGPETTPLSKQTLSLMGPTIIGDRSLIFVGGTSPVTEAAGPHQQSDESLSGSGKNCRRGSVDGTDGSRWITSLVSITTKSGHYCALGEGGFWKRGTYAATRAFVAHKYDGVNSFNASEPFGPAIAPGVATSYYSYQGYAGERLAARYASALGRDALRNMFREFWPDIATHVLHRHP